MAILSLIFASKFADVHPVGSEWDIGELNDLSLSNMEYLLLFI